MTNLSDSPSDAVFHWPELFFTALISACIAVLGIALALFQASLFDYRFGLTALAIVALGLIAGLSVSVRTTAAEASVKGAVWIAGSGATAAILIVLLTTIPFGQLVTYLSIAVFSAVPFFLCAIGLGRLRLTGKPGSLLWHSWAALLGAIIGSSLLAQLLSTQGPLKLAWAAAMSLGLLALVKGPYPRTIIFSGLGWATLCLLGFYMAWDFSIPPHWIQDTKTPVKQFYTETTTQRQIPRLATHWTTFGRTDVTPGTVDNKNSKSIFVNGQFIGSLPVAQPGADNTEPVAKDSSVATLPLVAGNPQTVMVINSAAGLLSRHITQAGLVQLRNLESNLALRKVIEGPDGDQSQLTGQAGITLEYGEIRHRLRHDGSRYDQIYLTLPQKLASGWTEPEPADNYLYTKEAFQEYWAHLKPGGMLVVLSGNEIQYMRAILTAWEILQEDKVNGGESFVRKAWGYRATSRTEQEPYQYMFMLVKGQISDEFAERVRKLADSMKVGLFGPGIVPANTSFSIYDQPYYILYHPGGLRIAQQALRDYASRRLGAITDMSASTDLRPFFFEVKRDLHPYLKWLLAVLFVLLAYVFLIPLPVERRLDSAATAAGPPLPVHLSYFLAIGVATTLGVVALFHQGILWTGGSGDALGAVLTGTAIGVLTGLTVIRRKERHGLDQKWIGMSVVALVSSVLLSWLVVIVDPSAWPGVLQAFMVGGFAFPLGIFAVILLIPGLQFVARNVPVLVSWSWVTFATAIVVGVVAALWIAQYWGFRSVWLTSAGCYGAMLAIGLWLSGSESHRLKQIASATKLETGKKRKRGATSH